MASEYVLAAGDKALALTISGVNAIAVGQPNEDAARTAALEQCQKYADAVQPSRKCEIYAVNGTVVYPHGRPPMPPLPWARRDPLTERPFSAKDMPIVRDIGKTRLETLYSQARKAKSIAIGPGGQFFYNAGLEAAEESIRRNLESCGAFTGVACVIVALDDVFVLPVPTTMKAIGLFHADRNPAITADAREELTRKLAEARPDGMRSRSAPRDARVSRSRR